MLSEPIGAATMGISSTTCFIFMLWYCHLLLTCTVFQPNYSVNTVSTHPARLLPTGTFRLLGGGIVPFFLNIFCVIKWQALGMNRSAI
eukprot:5277235-Pleurochrysis_carterae.AAC.1